MVTVMKSAAVTPLEVTELSLFEQEQAKRIQAVVANKQLIKFFHGSSFNYDAVNP